MVDLLYIHKYNSSIIYFKYLKFHLNISNISSIFPGRYCHIIFLWKKKNVISDPKNSRVCIRNNLSHSYTKKKEEQSTGAWPPNMPL